jgi:23S rRNA (guanine745-N1)-methyltransferase
MLLARRRFLGAGHYAPLAEAITRGVSAWLRGPGARLTPEARALVDCGCGEGYYLDHLARALEDEWRVGGWRLYGFDLARDAARMAASLRYGAVGATLFVASMWEHLPFASAGIGAALVIFAPRNLAELARVITPGGLLLVVTPASEHLKEARTALPWLLTPEPEKAARLRAALSPDFTLASARAVTFALALDAAALTDLAEMTPHRASRDASASEETRRAAARAVAEAAPGGRLAVTAACVVSAFTRAGPDGDA